MNMDLLIIATNLNLLNIIKMTIKQKYLIILPFLYDHNAAFLEKIGNFSHVHELPPRPLD